MTVMAENMLGWCMGHLHWALQGIKGTRLAAKVGRHFWPWLKAAAASTEHDGHGKNNYCPGVRAICI
jgi:hypothetical protein